MDLRIRSVTFSVDRGEVLTLLNTDVEGPGAGVVHEPELYISTYTHSSVPDTVPYNQG